jgi:hypothetical protein
VHIQKERCRLSIGYSRELSIVAAQRSNRWYLRRTSIFEHGVHGCVPVLDWKHIRGIRVVLTHGLFLPVRNEFGRTRKLKHRSGCTTDTRDTISHIL